MSGTTATQELVDWAWRLRVDDLPPSVHRAACRHLLDGLGCAAAAARLQPDAPAVQVALRTAAPAEATVIGTGTRVASAPAALANGALVHALDFDDTHADALVHATAAVLPTAFAVGERVAADGASVLTAAVAGYEVVTRLGAAVPHAFHARGFHATSVCGVFASALVAARLLGLDETQAVHALGIAGSTAAGSLEFLDTAASTKSLHPGLAAAAGITAADLAAHGATGPASILEGRYGLYAAYLGEHVDPALLTKTLGAGWETTRITIKPYPACQLSHATLDALADLRADIDDASRIARVVAEVPAGSTPIVCEPRADKLAPRSSYDAKFSLPWTAAALLLDGAVDVATFEHWRRPDVAELARRIDTVEVEHAGPPATAPGRVEVTLDDGTALRAESAAPRPVSDADVVAKFVANVGGDADAAAELAHDVLALAEVRDLSGLLARLTPRGMTA